MQSYNKTVSVIKKNEGDLFVALEFFEYISYWVSGILYLLFCSFSLMRAPHIVSASGFTKPGYKLLAPTHLRDGCTHQ